MDYRNGAISAPKDDPELITAQQLAERLQCCYHTVNRRARAGKIPFVQVGRSPRHRRYILEEVIDALQDFKGCSHKALGE